MGSGRRESVSKQSSGVRGILDSDKKDAITSKRKNFLWDLVATSVNEVNETRTKRTGEDARSKWQQIKCKAKGDVESLKKQSEIEFSRLKKYFILII